MDKLARSSRDVGHAIRQARKDRKMSQQELADKSGLWQETISKIENGAPGAKQETIFRVLAALQLEFRVQIRADDIDPIAEGALYPPMTKDDY